jgi:hypothetical protein
MDVRLGRDFKFPRGQRVRVDLDILNALNDNAAQGLTTASGPTFQQITIIPTPRAFRLGARYSF